MAAEPSRADLFLAQELGIRDVLSAKERLAAVRVLLSAPREVAQERMGQIALLAAANILCRLGPYCSNIAFDVPQGVSVAAGVPLLESGCDLVTALCRFLSGVQPPEAQATRRYGRAEGNRAYDLALSLGDTSPSARQVVWAWYDGWTGGFRRAPKKIDYVGSNPFGALLAGSLGAAAISRLLLGPLADRSSGLRSLPQEAALSAFSYGQPAQPGSEPDLVEEVDFQRLQPLLLVGGGAIASATALALACIPRVRGGMHVADDDVLERTNLERHLTSGWSQVGMLKVRALASLFADGSWNGLRLEAHPRLYEDLPAERWRTVLATTDNGSSRRRIQFELPRLLLNAGMAGSDFLVSRHDYRDGPCLECLYPEIAQRKTPISQSLALQLGLEEQEVNVLLTSGAPLSWEQVHRIARKGRLLISPEVAAAATKEGIAVLARAACTTAKVREDLPAATVGFVAAIPGVLLAAELVKEASFGVLPDRPVLSGRRNVFRMDLFGPLDETIEPSRPSRGCRCQHEIMKTSYKQRWGRDADTAVS